MRRAALLFSLCLAFSFLSGCASKPAAAASDSPDKDAAEKSVESGTGDVSEPSPSASGEMKGTSEDASRRSATADDAVEAPPPPPTFVLAPDEPAPPEAPESPEKAVPAAATTVVPPESAATAPPPAAKEKPKSAPKPKEAAPVLRPAEEKPAPSPPRETVPVPAAGMPELPTRPLPSAEDTPVTYSRTVRATVGQLVEIPFRGAGWVYLGELTAKKGLPYDSRRLDDEGQSFVFRAQAVGTYGLKFFREDFLADSILNDYVQVVVGEAVGGSALGGFSVPLDRGRVVAEPRWPPVGAAAAPASRQAAPSSMATSVQPAALTSGSPAAGAESSAATPPIATASPAATAHAAAAPAQTASSTAAAASPTTAPMGGSAPAASVASASAPAAATGAAASASGAPQGRTLDSLGPDALPEDYLSIVKAEADAGRAASALAVLDRFREKFPGGSDEAWWLYGRLLETNGPTKDVKAALGFYKRLVAEYPQSSRYDEARRRIAYLERYYFQIR